MRLDIPSSVRPKVLFLTEEGRQKRVRWANSYRRWTKKEWRGVLFADESPFHTKQSTGGRKKLTFFRFFFSKGGRKVRRPRTANRFDPKYTKPKVKKPEMIIFWGGIAASGRRVHGFFDPKEMVNSDSYCTMLRRKAVKVLKEENLILCHDH